MALYDSTQSMALVQPSSNLSRKQQIAVAIAMFGLFLFGIALGTQQAILGATTLPLALVCVFAGGWWYAHEAYAHKPAGISNNQHFQSLVNNRGLWGWLLAMAISGFYICLYWFPQYLQGLITLFEPLSQLLRNSPSDQWFVYSSFYTSAVIILGIKYIYKYRHQRYQVIRTLSVIFFQLGFGFLIPGFMKYMQQPEYYFTYFWPLKYNYLLPNDITWLLDSSHLGIFLVFWGIVMSFVAVPILTYFYGKRWYCSWVCGCGGLAETAGDSFRTLSDKSLKAWKIERWLIHSVLVFIVLTTLLAWLNAWFHGWLLGSLSQGFYTTYAFLIGSIFSGVVGTGFYPILGSRGWCRFGCPQAAILGIIQKYFSRFRITVNGGQCISCGNCSTYCEMGIDVKAYAQRGQDIVRASCVGCGVCSAVCPRGVLRLENGSDIQTRTTEIRTLHLGPDGIKLNDN